jgi:hypothetical protein
LIIFVNGSLRAPSLTRSPIHTLLCSIHRTGCVAGPQFGAGFYFCLMRLMQWLIPNFGKYIVGTLFPLMTLKTRRTTVFGQAFRFAVTGKAFKSPAAGFTVFLAVLAHNAHQLASAFLDSVVFSKYFSKSKTMTEPLGNSPVL